ncbi:hypothetical protein B0H11DRAFT_1925931 [Mycena galericulata]|nr:hypothetical protein B0H11DRAFT_1925931 [Mycena galericulata]
MTQLLVPQHIMEDSESLPEGKKLDLKHLPHLHTLAVCKLALTWYNVRNKEYLAEKAYIHVANLSIKQEHQEKIRKKVTDAMWVVIDVIHPGITYRDMTYMREDRELLKEAEVRVEDPDLALFVSGDIDFGGEGEVVSTTEDITMEDVVEGPSKV